MNSYLFRSDVTFADTNVVGNVYFANYFRWQTAGRNEWLHCAAPKTYERIFQRRQRIRVLESQLQFQDPLGVTVGERIEVLVTARQDSPRTHEITTVIQKCSGRDSAHFNSPLANGYQRFEIVDRHELLPVDDQEIDPQNSAAYVMDVSATLDLVSDGRIDLLDLIRLQGTCREQFLVANAPETLHLVANRSLALHTSNVRFQLHRDLRISPNDRLRLEMRLTNLRGGRLSVRFDYLLLSGRLRSVLFATGLQSVCCKRFLKSGLVPAVFPTDMLRALNEFSDSEELRGNIEKAIEFQAEEQSELRSATCVAK